MCRFSDNIRLTIMIIKINLPFLSLDTLAGIYIMQNTMVRDGQLGKNKFGEKRVKLH